MKKPIIYTHKIIFSYGFTGDSEIILYLKRIINFGLWILLI